MIIGGLILAAEIVLPEKGDNAGIVPRGFFGDVGLAFLAGIVILLGSVIWAVFFRKSSGETAYAGKIDSHNFGRRRKKKKERRRPHRGRNATLSETGGLPPLRSDFTDTTGKGDLPKKS